MTTEELQNSPVFKEWAKGKVVLIHNTYYDSQEGLPSYIVITQRELKHLEIQDFNYDSRAFELYKEGKHPQYKDSYRITRFWKSPNRKDQLDKIHVSVDHADINAQQAFEILLSDYSRGLA